MSSAISQHSAIRHSTPPDHLRQGDVATIKVQVAIEPVIAIALLRADGCTDKMISRDAICSLLVTGAFGSATDCDTTINLQAMLQFAGHNVVTDMNTEQRPLNRTWQGCSVAIDRDDVHSQLHVDVIDIDGRKLLATTIQMTTGRTLYIQCAAIFTDLRLEGGRYDPPTITLGS